MTSTNHDNNGHDHNALLRSILPIEELIKAGRQLQDLPTIENFARSLAKAIRTDPYDPSQNPEDRLREERFIKDTRDLKDGEEAADHAGITLRDAERRRAVVHRDLIEPKLPVKITGSAVAALALSIAPTLRDQFFDFEDKLTGWALAFAAGALVGMFITWSLVGIIDPSGKRNTVNWAGLFGAIGIGIFCFLLRLSSGDALSAVALSILEISTVVIVECLAGGLRERYRTFAAGSEDQTKASAEVQTHRGEADRRNQTLGDIQSRINAHLQYLAIRAFCAQKAKEIEQAALDIAMRSYHERLAEEDRLRKGLPKELR